MEYKRSILLYPFSLIWRFISGFRNFLFDSGILNSREFSIPVICIGNLSAGGTGKTPHAEYLIDLLNKSFNVAFLSRGYKRKTRGFLLAGPELKVSDIGDEPMQVFRKFPGNTVAVDRNRVRGISNILKERPETGIIILDDGFQHRRITPGLSILLSDYENLMIRDNLLPYGNLRESAHNMTRADIIIITKSSADLSPIQRRLIVKEISKAPYQNLYFTTFTYKNPVPVFENASIDTEQFSGTDPDSRGIVLVTGVVNPKPLHEFLKKISGEIILMQFSDHHSFTRRDISRIYDSWDSLKTPAKYVFTTEKDAVRLREFTNIVEPFRSSFYYVPLEIKFLNDNKDEFDNLIIDYVRKNKRNNRIS
jgi:tetraacyldisaccharide 4'-kinase